MSWIAVLAGVFCLSMATDASAGQKERPCADDVAKLCKGMQEGEGRIAKCLKEHSNELSPGCKKDIGEMKEQMQDFAQACKDDANKLCKGTKPGEGRITQCLKQHEGDLSAACKEKMMKPKGRRE